MFPKLKLLPFIALALAAPAPDVVDRAPQAIQVLTTCEDPNLGGTCHKWKASRLPTLCRDLVNQVNTISSAQTSPGISCNLYTGAKCTGRVQGISGTVNKLGTVSFNNVAQTFQCFVA